MAVQTSERGERSEVFHPSHTSRINSVSSQFSDGPMQSPSARSSTSSWSEEPTQTNMDISTGHMILVNCVLIHSYTCKHIRLYESEPFMLSVHNLSTSKRTLFYTCFTFSFSPFSFFSHQSLIADFCVCFCSERVWRAPWALAFLTQWIVLILSQLLFYSSQHSFDRKD